MAERLCSRFELAIEWFFCCDQFAVANAIAALPAASTAAEPRPILSRGLNILGGIPMAWLFLIVAGLCEIAWAIGLKYTEGFTRLLPTIGTVLAMAASIGFLGLALKSLPVGTAYAVWTGIGTVGTTVLGIYLFNEPATSLRLACIGFILLGIIGLRIAS